MNWARGTCLLEGAWFWLMLWALFASVATSATEQGELRFARHYSSEMVLQRDKAVVVRGWAKPGSSVALEFSGQKKLSRVASDGAWKVLLDPMPASKKGQVMTISSGRESLSLEGVLVGDVFLVALQSSVDISLGSTSEGRAKAKQTEGSSRFRAIRIDTQPSANLQQDLCANSTKGWTRVGEEEALMLSPHAFGLGTSLGEELKVPIGMVDLNLGNSFPVSWLSRETLETTEKFFGKTVIPGMITRFDRLYGLASRGEPFPKNEVVSSDPEAYLIAPATAYNGAIYPLRGLALKAALIQLGNDYPFGEYAKILSSESPFDRKELNRAYVQCYDIRKSGFRMESVTIPKIPMEWRKAFGDPSLPMGWITPPGSDLITLALHHREMRELIRLTAEENEGVEAILGSIAHLPFSSQPRDSGTAVERSLSWLKSKVYGLTDAPASGPRFEKIETDFNRATVHFRVGTAEGLRRQGEELPFFEVAGVEGEYVPASSVKIEGEVVKLESRDIRRIVHVRYNWLAKPGESLVNATGMPALPFRSEKKTYQWLHRNQETDLPVEYSTPANEWESGDVALINGQMKTHGYPHYSGWLGPIGIRVGPFGPNMGVREVVPDSPAAEKVLVGDVIFSVNGRMLGERAWEVMAEAITDTETEAGKGRLLLGLRRKGENLKVQIELEVMGTYSSTAPYDCPKTEKIVDRLERWLEVRGGGVQRKHKGAPGGAGFLNTDGLFLLGSGNPRLQGLVRRAVYGIMAETDLDKDIEKRKRSHVWTNSAKAILLGEYFHAKGDRNVLPYLKYYADNMAVTQDPTGGWKHYFPGGEGYGVIPNAGLPGVIGMSLAKEAGVEIDSAAFDRAIVHYGKNKAQSGILYYGMTGEREQPEPFSPKALSEGKLEAANGGLSAAGLLMEMVDDHKAAHICSFISAYAFNNTFGGHGGSFWGNFWTPLGAHAHSREAYIHFMKGHRWFRESNRMFDGSLVIDEASNVGGGTGLALVAPRQRLRITGAPKSPFAKGAPSFLGPAVQAFYARNYMEAQRLAEELLSSGEIGKDDLPQLKFLAREAREIQLSVASDLEKMKGLIEEGRLYEARLDLPHLEGILASNHRGLLEIRKMLAETSPRTDDRKTYEERMGLIRGGTHVPKAQSQAGKWLNLTSEIPVGKQKVGSEPGKVSPEDASIWSLKVVEGVHQSYEDWMKPNFDDSNWMKTTLPISWRMYHTALLRTTFYVENPEALEGLRFRGWVFRQQGIEIYINGKLVGKVNNLEKKTGNITGDLPDSAVGLLKKGKNTLAVHTRHNWRWGMLYMRVYNDGFGFRLDARLKP